MGQRSLWVFSLLLGSRVFTLTVKYQHALLFFMQRLLGPAMREALKRTSRSFWLSLRFLPRATRGPIALAYALARMADTIADGKGVSAKIRRECLKAFLARLADRTEKEILEIRTQAAVFAETDGERDLLELVGAGFKALERLHDGDRRRTVWVLQTLVGGMLQDMEWFPGQDQAGLSALEDREDLDRYTYLVAGCVGEYWTQMHAAHLAGVNDQDELLSALGIRFGKGLQLVNVLRDIPADLRRGRCYLPTSDLAPLGLSPQDLLDGRALPRVKPLLQSLLGQARGHLEAGWLYVEHLPSDQIRLRLCCLWPLLIGMRTLGLLKRSTNLLNPDRVLKIRRREVYELMAASGALIASPVGLSALWRRELKGAGILAS
jgi:farnesyl-diphosphate farnesyltransferase